MAKNANRDPNDFSGLAPEPKFSDKQLAGFFGHCTPASAFYFAGDIEAIVEEDDLNARRKPESDGRQHFEYEEHRWLGDTLKLNGRKSTSSWDPSAANVPLTLPNKLVVTYGQINGLAGDFFGTIQPICKGKDFPARKQLFELAFKVFGIDDSGKARAEKLLERLKKESDVINEALKKGKSVLDAYNNLPDESFQFDKDTQQFGQAPTYFQLLQNNFDHFGENARLAYNAGHAVAISTATQGQLELAYAQNAFADHFLEDSFSSGHFRVPREEMAVNFIANLCTNFMHNEDSLLGLNVEATTGKKWKAYGDKMLFEKDNSQDNMTQCRLALQTSVDEVYWAYQNKKSIDEKDFKAWTYAPNLKATWNVKGKNFAPMFKVENGIIYRRKDFSTPQIWEFVPVVKEVKVLGVSLLPRGMDPVSWALTLLDLKPGAKIIDAAKSWLKSKVNDTVLSRILGW